MAPRASTWDHKSDKDLLLTIIEMGTLKSIMWPEIAEKMTAKGYTFSKEACRQHFQKIRKESRTGTDSPSRPSQQSTNSTPAKPSAKRSFSTSFTNTSFTTSFTTPSDQDDDEEEDHPTPSKRQKMKIEANMDYGLGFAGQSAAQFKIEDLTGRGRGGVVDLERDDLYEAEGDWEYET